VTQQNAVLLAFHVDYWNQLGWPDRFSQARFSERQRAVAGRTGANAIYTPQVLLDGKDFRTIDRAAFKARLGSINRESARAAIRAQVSRGSGEVHVAGEVDVPDVRDRPNAEVWVAAFENGLSSQVQRGENAGRQLHHDFVVRGFAGPSTVDPSGHVAIDQRFRIGSDWDSRKMGIVVFVQRRDDGLILQSVATESACSF
jgi:hypothetical protein